MMTLLALATALGSTEIGVRAFASAPLEAQVPIGDPSEDDDGMGDEDEEEEDEDDEDDEARWS